MSYPIVVAIAKLSPGSRRLLTLARSIAMAKDDAELESIHLFMAASKMGRTGAGRLLPKNCKALLESNLVVRLQVTVKDSGSFLPISSPIKRACICLARSRKKIQPEDLLVQVFKQDQFCRDLLADVLGPIELEALEEKLLLKDFHAGERKRLRSIKELFGEEC